MVKISKQHADRNHRYNLKAVLMENKIDPTYKAIANAFVQVVSDKLGLETSVKSPKILGATEIAQHIQQHYNFVELVINEILTLGDDFSLFPEFGLFVNKNTNDNTFSCLSFKLKRGSEYFLQVSRFIGKAGKNGCFEAKVKIGSEWELLKSETILGLYEQIDEAMNTSGIQTPAIDTSDFDQDVQQSHVSDVAKPIILVKQ
jgi:hypothetical protein